VLTPMLRPGVTGPRSAWPQALMSGIPGPRFFELFGDLVRETFRRADPRERTEAQNPALERSVDTDVERHHQLAVGRLVNRLRWMPFARADVVGDRRLKRHLDPLWRSGVDAQ